MEIGVYGDFVADVGVPHVVRPDILKTDFSDFDRLKIKFISLPSSARIWVRGDTANLYLMSGSEINFADFGDEKLVFQQDDTILVTGKKYLASYLMLYLVNFMDVSYRPC